MKDVKFNIDEVFEIAAQVERNGGVFYRKASVLFKNRPEIEKYLNELAIQEDKHEKTFNSIIKKFSDNKSFAIENQLAVQYLDAIADQFVFNKENSDSEINPSMTQKEIFDIAIQKEKESIILYLGLKDILLESKDKQAVDLIIKEEQKHLIELRHHINNL